MNEERKLWFGKHKGESITKLMLTHLGYILWLLSNVEWFKLTNEEQELYDYMSIAAINSLCNWTFSREELKKHIKNKKALAKKDTPFVIDVTGKVFFDNSSNNPVVKQVLKYKKNNGCAPQPVDIVDLLDGFRHSFNKMIEKEPLDPCDEELFSWQ